MSALGLFSSLRGYQGKWLRSDAIAGLTVWAVLVPESLAYGSLAGASPIVGLYAVPAALILYASFGSSRHLVTGPMSATAALSAGAIAQFVTNGGTNAAALTAAVAIATGIAALVAGLLRLGFVATLISEPVLKGFIIGIALTVIAGQLSKLLGIHGVHGNFFEQIWGVIKHLGDVHGATAAVGLSSLAVIFGLEHFAPRIPAMLVVVVYGIVVVKALNLQNHGVHIVGEVPGGLPTFGLPDVAANHYLVLGRDALAIMLLSFVEGLAAAKNFAAKNGYEINANRELIGLGAANLGSGFSGGMVVGGSVGKTAVNGGAGARTELSGLVAAVLAVVTLLFLTGLFKYLPEPTLAAIVIAAVVGLVDIPAIRQIWGVRGRALVHVYGLPVAARPDFLAAVAALGGVLIFEALPGLFIGLAISLVLLLFRTSRPHLAVLGRIPGTEVWADAERHSGTRARRRRVGRTSRGRAVLRQRRCDPSRAEETGGRAPSDRGRARPRGRPGDRHDGHRNASPSADRTRGGLDRAVRDPRHSPGARRAGAHRARARRRRSRPSKPPSTRSAAMTPSLLLAGRATRAATLARTPRMLVSLKLDRIPRERSPSG